MKAMELLPAGSVVRLKNAEKRLMIFGVRQTSPVLMELERPIETDYIGVLYPEGNIGEEHQYFFSHNSIEEIYFRGFEDEERDAFIGSLEEYYGE